MSLWSEFLNHDGKTIHKWKHYFPAYERHFGRYVNRPLTFLEIGCGEGGSLQMWKRYFGPHALIVGVDSREECRTFQDDQIAIRVGRQSDQSFLAGLLEEFGTPDVVLDDGSHLMKDIATTFATLYPKIAADGVYAVEDLHTAYWKEFGGGLREPGSFIEICKGLIDELNADLSRGAVPQSGFSRETQSMHFYDSLVIFERGRTRPKTAPMMPPPGTRPS